MGSRSLNLYRKLLRAQRIAFEGDAITSSAAKIRIRQEFEKHLFETDSKKLEKVFPLLKFQNSETYFFDLIVVNGTRESSCIAIKIKCGPGKANSKWKFKIRN